MSDDFGTVNVKRGERSKEIDALRQQYGHHRDALARMIADAPTELLAKEYQRLIREVDASIRKLDELEGRVPDVDETQRGTDPEIHPIPVVPPPVPPAAPRATAGERPLATAPGTAAPQSGAYAAPASDANPRSRVALIVAAAVVVLALIGWMIYRASSDRRQPGPIAGTAPSAIETVGTNPAATTAPEPIAPPAGMAATGGAGAITIAPASADYGTIRKGTRAVRQFEVTNTSTAPIEIAVGRSTCRCLFYDYRDKIPAKGKETVTVTIDGARVKGNALNETVTVKSKKDPSVSATFDVTAAIR